MPGGGGWSRRAPPSVRALATPALATGVRSGAEPSSWGSDVVSRGVVSELSWRVGHPDGVGELLGVGESAHTCAHVHTRTHTCRTHTTRAHAHVHTRERRQGGGRGRGSLACPSGPSKACLQTPAGFSAATVAPLRAGGLRSPPSAAVARDGPPVSHADNSNAVLVCNRRCSPVTEMNLDQMPTQT